MRTRARRDGDDWVLDGRKMWITNGSVADVAVVWAQTDEGIRGFVVPTDTPGFSAPEIKHKMSLRASVTSELVLDGVRLPARRRAARTSPACAGRCRCLNEARYGIVWGAHGRRPVVATRPPWSTPTTAPSSAGRSPASS